MSETEHEARMARISVEAAVVAEEVWTEDEPTLAEYELTQTILDTHARLADRDAAGVETLGMVSGLLMAYGDESSDEFLVHQLRAALSGPADEHPADGTGT